MSIPLINFERSTICTGFIPDAPHSPDEVSSDEYSVVKMEGYGELGVLSRVLRIALAFGQDRPERTRLGHDCAVFALACVTDNALHGRVFTGPKSETVYLPETRTAPIAEVDISTYGKAAGSVVCTYAVTAAEGLPPSAVEDSFHAQVRATHPDEPAFFASKLGGTGIVAFQTLEESIRGFRSTTIYEAGDPVVEHKT